MSEVPIPPNGMIQNSASVELASNRTSLSLERTRMAKDRTLMATVRTCFSLISFGFTLNQVFKQLEAQPGALRQASPHYFGLALVLLGVLMLIMGIVGHRRFMRALAGPRAHHRRAAAAAGHRCSRQHCLALDPLNLVVLGCSPDYMHGLNRVDLVRWRPRTSV